jgi:CHAT domain-containing protein
MLASEVYQLYLQAMDADGMLNSAERMQTQLAEMSAEGGGQEMMAQMFSSGLASLMSGEISDTLTSGVANYALSQMAGSFVEQASVLVPLYRAREKRDQGDEAGAEQLYAQARTAAQAASADQRDILEAQVYAQQKAYPQAKQAFQRYLERGGANVGFVGQLASLMQTVGGQQGQLEAAQQQRRTYEQAFTFLVRVKAFDEARGHLLQLEQLGGKDWWQDDPKPWQSLSDCGELYEGLDDLDTSLAYYDQAIQELEARRTMLSHDELKTALAADKGAQYLYFQAARTALKLAASVDAEADSERFAGQAHGYAERGKARALLDLMVSSAAVAGTTVNDRKNVRAWRQHNARLTLWRGLLAQEHAKPEPDQQKIAALQGSIEAEEASLHQVERQLAESDPGFYDSLNPQAQVLSLEGVRDRLPPGTALLQYYFLGDDLLAWAITPKGDLITHALEVDAKWLSRQIFALQRACENRQPLDELGDQLAEMLLKPFQALIEQVEQLIIVPYGAAHVLPFHVLPWRNGEPLAASHALSYLPSASVLQFRQPGEGTSESILAVGDPANMAYTPPLGDRKRRARSLPAAGTEAAYVASLFPNGEALIGPQATEETVRAKLSEFPILHFATHGRLSEETPMLSSILLAEGEELSLYELMGMQLSADLVVLSACRTGVGETTGGDDVLGLTRGLLGAGARAAVVSLWPVDDLSTSLLMGEFYRQLLKGKPPASALQEAQNYLRNLPSDQIEAKTAELGNKGFLRDVIDDGQLAPVDNYAHAHHWAPFILVG